MKKMLIILMALVAFVSITAFGSEPTDDNAPLPTEEDIFLSDLSQLSEEELMEVFGNYLVSAAINHDTDECTKGIMRERLEQRIGLYIELIKEGKLNDESTQAYKQMLLNEIGQYLTTIGLPALKAYVTAAIGTVIGGILSGSVAFTPTSIAAALGSALVGPEVLSAAATAAIVAAIIYLIDDIKDPNRNISSSYYTNLIIL